MPLTQEQFQKARASGFTAEQIIEFEKKRLSETPEVKPKDQFLPGTERVEKLRGERPPITTTPFERFASPKNLKDLILNPMARVPDVLMGAGEAGRTVESSLSRGGLKAQEGGRGRDIVRAFYGEDVTQKPAEFGDIPRKAGVPEPLSKAIGLGTAMAIPEVTSLGQFGRGITKTTKEVSEELTDTINTLKTKLPQKMGDDWLIVQAQKTYSVADDTIKAMNKEMGDFYTAHNNTAVSVSKLKRVMADLFGKTTDEAEKLEIQEIVEKLKTQLPEGAFGNIKTTKILKDTVQNYIPESAWLKGKKGMNLTPLQKKRVKAYFDLKELIEENITGEDVEYLDYMNKKATDVYRTSKAIKKMVISETGEPTNPDKLISIFGGKTQSAGKRLLFRRLNELNEHAQDVIKNMGKFRRRQELKGLGKTAVYGYGVYEVLRRMFGQGNR